MSEPHLNICPVCAGAITRHDLADEKNYESWEYVCGAEIIRQDNGRLADENPCQHALRQALAIINAASPPSQERV